MSDALLKVLVYRQTVFYTTIQQAAEHARLTGLIALTVHVIPLIARPEPLSAEDLCLITAVSAREKRSLLVITTMANMCVTKTGHNAAQPVQITPVPVVPIAKSID